MTVLLCFGDSLTWGADPGGVTRHAMEDRWPTALRHQLDAQGILPDLTLIADGLCGRTTAFPGNPSAADVNGATLLPTVLATHAPVDGLAIMLGTNDIWCDIAPPRVMRGLRRLVEIARSHPMRDPSGTAPKILLVAPPPMVEGAVDSPTQAQIAASHDLAPRIQVLAAELGCAFANASDFASASPRDGVHLEATATRALGTGLAASVAALFG